MKRPRVLIIEDNDHSAYLMRYLLEQAHLEVEHARTGPEGLDAAERRPPDLVLLDIRLPDLDGYTVAARLREHPKTAATPIIAVTSHAMVGDREKSLAAGCTDHIEKPLDLDAFLSLVRATLGGENGGTAWPVS